MVAAAAAVGVARGVTPANAISRQTLSRCGIRLRVPHLFVSSPTSSPSVQHALGRKAKRMEQPIELEGRILPVLAATMFRLELDNKHSVPAHISGKMRKRFIRLTAGDRVKIEMSPYGLNKARIVYRLGSPASFLPPRRRPLRLRFIPNTEVAAWSERGCPQPRRVGRSSGQKTFGPLQCAQTAAAGNSHAPHANPTSELGFRLNAFREFQSRIPKEFWPSA